MPDETTLPIAEIREALAKATGGNDATLQKLMRAKEILSQSRPEPVIVYPQSLVHQLVQEHQDALERIEALEARCEEAARVLEQYAANLDNNDRPSAKELAAANRSHAAAVRGEAL